MRRVSLNEGSSGNVSNSVWKFWSVFFLDCNKWRGEAEDSVNNYPGMIGDGKIKSRTEKREKQKCEVCVCLELGPHFFWIFRAKGIGRNQRFPSKLCSGPVERASKHRTGKYEYWTSFEFAGTRIGGLSTIGKAASISSRKKGERQNAAKEPSTRLNPTTIEN